MTGAPKNLVGENLIEIIPEFFGYEEELWRVRRQQLAQFSLESINRAGIDGRTNYYNFTVIADEPAEPASLVLLVTNVTEQGRYVQALTQSRNELTLARQRLANLSFKLDYVIRHYLAPEVTDALMKGDMNLELGGHLRDISVLFADARNFTRLSQQLSPGEVVQVLNSHMDIIADAVALYEGTITQFQGDNVIALFNDSDQLPQHAINAVRAGIAIQQALANYHRQPEVKIALGFGVGINSGPALIGNIGAKNRFSYTASGDTVNVAARITTVTPAHEIWISQATRRQLPNRIEPEPMPPVTFKGISQPVEIFKVNWVGIGSV
ncbi:MAG: hypothetical protein Kow0031_06440 [Anaerolineae bacterium]